MGAAAVYPTASWSEDDPLNEASYGAQVHLMLGGAKWFDDGPNANRNGAAFEKTGDLGDYSVWATQPWNNVGFNTYQPIPSGVHMLKGTGNVAERSSRVLRFVAQYYDSSKMPPTAFEVL